MSTNKASLKKAPLLTGLITAIFISFISLNTFICFKLGNDYKSVIYHFVILGLTIYLMTAISFLWTSLLSHRKSQIILTFYWPVTLITTATLYLTYYLSITNWGATLHYGLILDNIKEIPYIWQELPIKKSVVIGICLAPSLLLGLVFSKISGKLDREQRTCLRSFKKKRSTLRNTAILILPLLYLLLSTSIPLVHQKLYSSTRTQYDPILAFLQPVKFQHSHKLIDLGIEHELALEQYPKAIASDKPNVIFFICDALRADRIGSYGYSRKITPTLDSLSQLPQSLNHHRYFSVSSHSYPGITATMASRERLSVKRFMLHEALRKQGYDINFILSGFFSKFYNIREYFGDEIDFYYDGITYQNDPEVNMASASDDLVVIPAGLRKIQPYSEKPAFFYFHFMSAHQTGAFNQKYEKYTPAKWNVGQIGKEAMVNNYDNRIWQLDHQINNTLKDLKRKGYLEDALVVITSDHGQALMENNRYWHGKSTEMPETWIPLILSYLGNRAFPTDSINSVNSQIDAAPTVIDLLGLPMPTSWEGQSVFSSHTSLPLYQSEADTYSAIFKRDKELFQLSFHEKENTVELYNISDPKQPLLLDDSSKVNLDSLVSLLKDHYRLD